MTLEEKNQNDIIYNELINSYEIEYIFNNEPINRFTKPNKSSNKSELLSSLKEKILKLSLLNEEIGNMESIIHFYLELFNLEIGSNYDFV